MPGGQDMPPGCCDNQYAMTGPQNDADVKTAATSHSPFHGRSDGIVLEKLGEVIDLSVALVS